MLDPRRLAVFVDAKERDVEIVAREGEVVVVAAEIRDLLLRREDEPDVGVSLVPMEPVLTAAVKRDDSGSQVGRIGRRRFDRRDGRAARRGRIGVAGAGLDGRIGPVR